MLVIGVDGHRERWVVVALSSGLFAGASTFATLPELLRAVPDAMALAVNLPTALVAHGARRCDALVREHAKPHVADLLDVPPGPVLTARTSREAERLTDEHGGPPLAGRSAELLERILTLYMALRAERSQDDDRPSPGARDGVAAPYDESTPGLAPRGSLAQRLQDPGGMGRWARVVGRDGAPLRPKAGSRMPAGRIVEAHAEASFRELSGDVLPYARSTTAGRALRLALLRQASIDLPAKLPTIGGVGVDELIDAAALAWTAHRYALGRARSLPTREHWQLDQGHIVAVWL